LWATTILSVLFGDATTICVQAPHQPAATNSWGLNTVPGHQILQL
jgi:hypothetical protein